MKTFSDRWRQLDWDDIRLRINGKTAADVERALNASQLTRDDMMALLSPAASGYLEQLAQRAQRLTRQRFGNTVSFYVPLYLSNLCANDCTYCGFSMSNRIKRKTLDEADIARESAAIREMGFEHLLLVTGEHQAKVGMDYFRRHLPALREQFSSLQMEVQPLAETEYAELKQLGLDGVMVYQETYHEATYARHHLKGKKQDFFWRLETPDRLGRAGIDKIGLGALIGLSDNWRVDSYMVAEHLLWLQQHYDHQTRRNRTELIGGFLNMNNKMITIPYADAIEYGENTSALFKALWELTDLIRLESDLKKHHRAYLHVREDIDEKVKEARQIMTKVSVDMIGFYFKVDVPKCSNSDENTPFADAADDETVSIPKDEYELMIDDLLTMSEIIQCVADMRTQDVKAIREFGKFVPAFAAFEKNRLSLYREAAKEAEEIFDRWADEIDDLDEDFMEDEDYEPDEYYSD